MAFALPCDTLPINTIHLGKKDKNMYCSDDVIIIDVGMNKVVVSRLKQQGGVPTQTHILDVTCKLTYNETLLVVPPRPLSSSVAVHPRLVVHDCLGFLLKLGNPILLLLLFF